MFKNFPILRYIVLFFVPFILVYAIYIQLNGDLSPGGGFQGGVIFATAIVGYDFVTGINFNSHLLDALIYLSVSGFVLILTVAILPIFFGGCVMEYGAFSKNIYSGQHLGIFFLELGIGITVSSTITMMYFLIKSTK